MSTPKKSTTKPAPIQTTATSGGYVAEADFDDTIAHNRALPILDASTVPKPPAGYRPTDSEMASRRLRRIGADHRSEACDALREAAARDLQKDLGRFAPDPKRAPALLDRLTRSGQLVQVAQALFAYAREVDRIALNDACVFLEAENKELTHTLEHDPALAPSYAAIQKLFAARSEAIVEGMARAREAAQAPAAAPPVNK